ncbi:MAG TPA: aldehyde dehydrogenase family protein, partial [Nitrospiria bacterium]|nr:aldehyde dehydrogenase family protein [Nitrospiria bacterium]
GRWQPAASGRTLESRNPADTSEVVAVAPASSSDDVGQAVAAAKAAFPAWRAVPAPKRGEILFRAAERLARDKEAVSRIVTREMGKVIAEARGDVQEAVDMAYYMAGEGRRLAGQTVPSELPNKDAKSVRVPLGVCGLITPWNFPVAIPSWKILPALVAGNTAVIKPSELTPLCATRFVQILQDSGLPPGVLNLVHGYGEDAGGALVSHPDVNAVSFTGSSAVGEQVEAACGRLHRPVCTETGGKNPLIVMEDADLDLAVEGALWGGFGTSGQRCTAASRVIVHQAAYDAFLARFVDAAKRLRLGSGLDPKTHVGPVISADQKRMVLEYIAIGKKEGAKLLCGGHAVTDGALANGHFIAPTVFGEVAPAMRIAQEEIFGPVVSVIKARDYAHAIEIANNVAYGLSAAIYTRDVNTSAMAERDLDTGIVYVNASTIGAEIQLPFGGTKRTGLGPREAGGRGGALELYTKWKVIYRDFSGKLQKAQIDA